MCEQQKEQRKTSHKIRSVQKFDRKCSWKNTTTCNMVKNNNILENNIEPTFLTLFIPWWVFVMHLINASIFQQRQHCLECNAVGPPSMEHVPNLGLFVSCIFFVVYFLDFYQALFRVYWKVYWGCIYFGVCVFIRVFSLNVCQYWYVHGTYIYKWITIPI